MIVSDFHRFVEESDQFKEYSTAKRLEIAIQGLMGEVGSVVAAVKKEGLREGGALASKLAKVELQEELGDVLWYVFAVSRMDDVGESEDVFVSDIKGLREEIGRDDERAEGIHKVLTPERAKEFLRKADAYPGRCNPTFGGYQSLAWLTARTEGETLLTVCAAVLAQLGAQLMRHLLPEVEHRLNVQLKDRPIRIILAEICWHIAAIATLYELDLDAIAKANVDKNRFRKPDREPTPLHDQGRPEGERLPRQFEVKIRTISEGVSEMLLCGERLGDPLKDNSHQPDGYRFHDVMHLANAAHLGWSPVLRKMMKRKRSTDTSLDDVEDGGRAAVVEEAIVKVIHAEAMRRARIREPESTDESRKLFPAEEEIPFALLKLVQRLAEGHEVYANKAWEWEGAIRSGYGLFQKLRDNKEGLITVDLERRSITYKPVNEQ